MSLPSHEEMVLARLDVIDEKLNEALGLKAIEEESCFSEIVEPSMIDDDIPHDFKDNETRSLKWVWGPENDPAIWHHDCGPVRINHLTFKAWEDGQYYAWVEGRIKSRHARWRTKIAMIFVYDNDTPNPNVPGGSKTVVRMFGHHGDTENRGSGSWKFLKENFDDLSGSGIKLRFRQKCKRTH